ncbi:hypothetical protein QD460_25970 [Rhizobium jaguaris]|uniref:hypothetical protein n=1 Tax=Rhizobium jaguaris TaxID=1312183 RepID=UPI0039BF3AF9
MTTIKTHNFKRTIAVAVAVTLSLSGCVSHAIHDKSDDANCQAYGAKPGTEMYMNCRLQTDANRSAHRIAAAQGQMAI